MIEMMAKALAELEYDERSLLHDSPATYADACWPEFVTAARTALKAMRTPVDGKAMMTQRMFKVFWDVYLINLSKHGAFESFNHAWCALIDDIILTSAAGDEDRRA